ncbi:MAG: DNA-methyltransferase [Candidatus Heimdallarchaeaceae archaeon]
MKQEMVKTNIILNGDCIKHLKQLPDNSVDAIITDPPYGLGFMGKEWDTFKPSYIEKHKEQLKTQLKTKPRTDGRKVPATGLSMRAGQYDFSIKGLIGFQKWFQQISKEFLRVLKPGGFLLSFGGTRTYHRLVCGIEDAGFEIRDTIMWLYGSGFPKSLNIGKQIDKIQGNEREVLGKMPYTSQDIRGNAYESERAKQRERIRQDLTKGNSEWEGWGTALKPACEPIVVARKPLSEKNVALNVLKWGTGGINVSGCRVEYTGKTDPRTFGGTWKTDKCAKNVYEGGYEGTNQEVSTQGRFPANIILDEEAGRMLDEQSGVTKSGKVVEEKDRYNGESNTDFLRGITNLNNQHGDKGGASRFFYCAKASKSERNLGCEEMEQKDSRYEDNSAKSLEIFSNQYTESSGNPTGRGITSKRANNHPTVKPIALMEYLIKLVSREGAIILDPFLGSGTTAIACLKLNRKFIGIEKEEEYVKIAKARIKHFSQQTKLPNAN